MTEFLGDWVSGVTATAIICALAMLLTPRVQAKQVLGILCGVMMMVAMFRPLVDFDLGDYGLNLSKYRSGAETLTADAEELRKSLDRNIIEEKLEAYILDKAQSMGSRLDTVQVTLQWSTEGLWYPSAAELEGEYHEALARLIEAELGIPMQAQTWRTNGDD